MFAKDINRYKKQPWTFIATAPSSSSASSKVLCPDCGARQTTALLVLCSIRLRSAKRGRQKAKPHRLRNDHPAFGQEHWSSCRSFFPLVQKRHFGDGKVSVGFELWEPGEVLRSGRSVSLLQKAGKQWHCFPNSGGEENTVFFLK